MPISMEWAYHGVIAIALLVFCILLNSLGLILLSRLTKKGAVRRRREESVSFSLLVFLICVLGATMLFGLQAVIWSLAYFHFGAISQLQGAINFSIGVFTTYGNSGVQIDQRWILMSELQAVNGVMAFGLTTGFLFSIASRLHHE